MKPNAHNEIVEASQADIDELLGDLEVDEMLDETTVLETIEAPVSAQHAELDQDEERALDADMTRIEMYEEQAESSVTDIAAEAPAPPVKAAKTPKAPAKPRVERDLNALPAETFVISTDIPEDLEANKAAVIAKRPTQKKIAEKFDNLFAAVNAGRTPSVFIMECFTFLKGKGEASLGELIAHLESKSYSKGTASSQAGQIMTLFDVTGIATRNRQTLTINPKSTIALALSEHIATPA